MMPGHRKDSFIQGFQVNLLLMERITRLNESKSKMSGLAEG